jgi:FPC/CPF motif-containing protein YcgG
VLATTIFMASLTHEADTSMNRIRITVASSPHRDEVVAELWDGLNMWAELSHDDGDWCLTTFPHPQSVTWELPYEEVLSALEEARKRLSPAPTALS